MVFKFKKILFLEFRVARVSRVSKKRPGSVRVFKNTGTVGQISGRVWTRPSPKCNTNGVSRRNPEDLSFHRDPFWVTWNRYPTSWPIDEAPPHGNIRLTMKQCSKRIGWCTTTIVGYRKKNLHFQTGLVIVFTITTFFSICVHSSEIRVLCLMKLPSETL